MTVDELIDEIQNLSDEDFAELMAWIRDEESTRKQFEN
jgi:Mg/Co/Ni transporter MgtE